MSGSGPIYEYQRELTAKLEQVMRERDEAQAELSSMTQQLELEREHSVRLRRECEERHDELRAEVERLREHVAQLSGALHAQSAVAFAVEHVAKGKAAGADALRTVAERQREACAERLHALLSEKKATAVWVGADEIRMTPLVTEGNK